MQYELDCARRAPHNPGMFIVGVYSDENGFERFEMNQQATKIVSLSRNAIEIDGEDHDSIIKMGIYSNATEWQYQSLREGLVKLIESFIRAEA